MHEDAWRSAHTKRTNPKDAVTHAANWALPVQRLIQTDPDDIALPSARDPIFTSQGD